MTSGDHILELKNLTYISFSRILFHTSMVVCGFHVPCNFLWADNRYQCKNTATVRQRRIRGTELPLNRLREPSDSMMTEFNPTYEFGGWTYTIQDLKDIPRDQLRLVK